MNRHRRPVSAPKIDQIGRNIMARWGKWLLVVAGIASLFYCVAVLWFVANSRDIGLRLLLADDSGATRFLERYDDDGDDGLSIAEMPEQMQDHWTRIDSNSDARVTLTELQEAFRNGGMLIATADIDGDGKLAGEEIPEGIQERLAEFDDDENGALDPDELVGPEIQKVTDRIEAKVAPPDEGDVLLAIGRRRVRSFTEFTERLADLRNAKIESGGF